MAFNHSYTTEKAVMSTTETNKVLKSTYFLLAMTLAFSALTAAISMTMALPRFTGLVCSLVAMGLIFVIQKKANSSSAIGLVFLFTGILGFGLGPLLNSYLNLPNGGLLIAQALGSTALIFFGLSAYALTTKKDFSFMGGFLTIGILVTVGISIVNIFIGSPIVFIAINAVFVLLMSAMILFETSRIVNGGETNYVLATVGLFVAIYNLFTSLLMLLGVMSSDD
ncbi:Bax inhibitor-1/YccA family protein [Pseudoalteromonas luteoviolacea]|uniref:TEGT family transporter n=1 Tax=Pseudoalteromonas luteoviolacea H33 TaxID=1365251 RepID=A0A167ABK0_9GAMM|nr:Bax inhibitor-1/YccA family protein [Pseudoalteromonas luteoviolacea]KZN45190.1 TEGT family transporter [Pseudoalteromonas luteoviolacea H33]KZN70946.1 TEGT family transporter [Pseudoalteromonas luteoviolacea H33-S]MBQ4877275.1 Bax inhibitor-1/YccA family protein [Pseudoalteromonas luteoviolacea]MBQ4906136.1 Bax inhibitor-1/YccA family protein [Pseudoalteromonas luteoviolacea]